MPNPAQELIKFGQSIWYDNISRDILKNGELKRLIAEWGIRGITSNPSIFEKAIASSSLYDSQIAELSKTTNSSDEIFERLALQDIAEAADILLPLHLESDGNDGFVSIEVSPLLAADTAGTIKEAKRLFASLSRPNIMIKIPGTKEGIPAIKAVLEEGINVNVTLLFSVDNYREVAETYVDALRTRYARGQSIKDIRSVASFFVSRVDSVIDAKLNEIVSSNGALVDLAKSLLGTIGIANSKLAYKFFKEIFESETFADLIEVGGAPQRPLWASTGTKNPNYSDVLYVDQLIAKDTVNTLPPATLEAFVDHGRAAATLEADLELAENQIKNLSKLDIELNQILNKLQMQGVAQFSDSFHALNKAISAKL